MLSGGFPGQLEAIKERFQWLKEEGRKRATRRLFLGLAVGGVAGACAGGGAVHVLEGGGEPKAAPPPAQPLDPALDPWRKLATGPLGELLAKSSGFMAEADRFTPGDQTLWLGMTRIANAVVERDPRVPAGTRSGFRSLRTLPHVPDLILAWIELIQSAGR